MNATISRAVTIEPTSHGYEARVGDTVVAIAWRRRFCVMRWGVAGDRGQDVSYHADERDAWWAMIERAMRLPTTPSERLLPTQPAQFAG